MGVFVEQGDGLPGRLQAPQSVSDQLLDTVMLRLRLADGLDLAAIAEQHGTVAANRILAALEPRLDSGLVSVAEGQQRPSGPLESADREMWQGRAASTAGEPRLSGSEERVQGTGHHGNGRRQSVWPCLRLTDPDGFLVSNDIISDVFAALT